MSATPKETIMARIRALQAKTTASGCTEAEAEAAASTVDRLLEQYELTIDEVTIKTSTDVEMTTIENVGHHAVRYAAKGVSEFCDCKVWLDNHDNDLVFLGLEVDVQIAEYLTLLFWRAIDRESGAYTLLNPDYTLSPRSERESMKWSFEVGMAGRLAERLKTLKSKRDFARQQTGTSLVLAKQPLIDGAFATLGISLGQSRGRRAEHNHAYLAGRTAAEGVSIGQGIAGRGNTAGRIK
jgi:hypothetical protein